MGDAALALEGLEVKDKLTKRQEAFAQHYAIEGNATAAYRAAGYSTKGKPETSHVKAQEVRKKVKVAARIETLTARKVKRAEDKFDITVDRILDELAAMAFYDPADYFAWSQGGVILKSSDEMTERQRRAITAVTQKKGQTNSIRLEFGSKQAALEKIGKHLGMFKDKVEHSGPDGAPLAPTIIQVQTVPRGAILAADGTLTMPTK